MVKYFLFLLFAAAPFDSVWAQDDGTGSWVGAGRFEGEVAVGATFGYSSLRGYRNTAAGPCLAVECRYNFRRLPFDAGLRIDASFYSRWPRSSCSSDPFPVATVMAVADYNVQVTRRMALYAGVGVGYAAIMRTAAGAEVDDGSFDGQIRFAAMPRIGCECWNRLRVTLGYVCTERANRHLTLTVGIAIGGRR